jgi:hypothetical protein
MNYNEICLKLASTSGHKISHATAKKYSTQNPPPPSFFLMLVFSSASFARPYSMHDAFEQFGAFTQDGVDNK